jgi:predicted dehydrogenase
VRFGLIGCGWIVERNHAPTDATVEATFAAYAADARSSWIDLPIPPDDPLYARGVAALV